MLPGEGASVPFTSRGNPVGTSLGSRGQSTIDGADEVLGCDDVDGAAETRLGEELGWPLEADDSDCRELTLGAFDADGPAEADGAEGSLGEALGWSTRLGS